MTMKSRTKPIKTLPLRSVLLLILLGGAFVSVAALGSSSYYFARRSAHELLRQVLDGKTALIVAQTERLVDSAAAQNQLNLSFAMKGPLTEDDFPRLAQFFADAMDAHPELSWLSLTLEHGGMIGADRSRIQEVRKSPRSGRLEWRDYDRGDYPRRAKSVGAGDAITDPRHGDWFVEARRAGRPVWTETFIFPGDQGRPDLPGTTCAAPVYRADGSLAGVVTADFDTQRLCEFLKTLVKDEGGAAFVVELKADGSRPVVAHSSPEVLLREAVKKGQRFRELVPVAEIADARLQAFLALLPPDAHLGDEVQFGAVRFISNGCDQVGGYRRLRGRQAPAWVMCTVLPEQNVMHEVWVNTRLALFAVLAVFAVAALASGRVTRQMAQPLELLARETEAVGRFDLAARPAPRSAVLEVDRLAQSVEAMKTGLRSFQKYVPADLVRQLLGSSEEARLGGERRTLTFFFSDIEGFTSIAERLSPEGLVEHMHEYLSAVAGQILAAGGTVDKYIGDAAMAFWGAPAANPSHAADACTAAVRCQQLLSRLGSKWRAEGKPLLPTRIGLHTGEAVVGNMGSQTRLNYTALGDSVNLASRLEGLNKYYGTAILISDSTFRQARDAVVARPLDYVAVKGKTEPVLVYELLGIKGEIGPQAEGLAELAGRALALYCMQDFEAAARLFRQVLRLQPEDSHACLMIQRCEEYLARPPGAGWEGVHHMDQK